MALDHQLEKLLKAYIVARTKFVQDGGALRADKHDAMRKVLGALQDGLQKFQETIKDSYNAQILKIALLENEDMSREWVKTARNLSIFLNHVNSAALLLHPELDLAITPEAVSESVILLKNCGQGLETLFQCGKLRPSPSAGGPKLPKMDRSPEQEVLFSAPIWTDLAKHVKAGLTAKLKLLQRRVLDHKHCPTMLAAWHRLS